MKHETHPSKLHLTAIVANHHLNPNSLLQAPMTPLPYGWHQEVYDLEQTKSISQAPLLYLVSSNLIICPNHSSTNYRIHHFNFFKLFFSFHSLVYFAPTSSCHSYKIQHLGFLVSVQGQLFCSCELLFLETSFYQLQRPIISFWLSNLVQNLYATSFLSTYYFSLYLGNIISLDWSISSAPS